MTVRLPPVPAGSGSLRLVGGTLVDGTGAPPVPDAELLVRDDTIVYAGPRRAGRVADEVVVDVDGGWILPGFVDAHVHLAMDDGRTPVLDQESWFDEEFAFATADRMRRTLACGVTSVRDLGGLTPGYRNAVARGEIGGPRLHLSIAMLSPTGGHADPVRANGSMPLWARRAQTPTWALVDSRADVRRAVRTLVRTGADVVKVCTSGGMSTPHDHPSDRGMPAAHVRLAVEETALRQGQPVAAHAQTDEAVRAAVLGGVRSIEHGYEMSDATIALLIEHDVILVPTLSTLLRDRGVRGGTELDQRRAVAVDAIRRAVAAGVEVALGTDAGIHPHGANLRELAHLVGVGLSPLAAIRAGTLTGARLLGLEDRIGSLEPGKLGDAIVVDVDPLARTDALSDPDRVRLVLQSGRVVKDLEGPRRR